MPRHPCLWKAHVSGHLLVFQPCQSLKYKPLFPSKARNCVNGHAHGKQHPWASLATASPGIGMLRVSTDIPQLPVPGVCAELGQAPLLRGFAGSRRVLGSVPPFKASPDLDSLPARAPPPGSALPPLLPAAGRGPAERAGLLLLMPVASAPAERGASLCRPIQPYRPFPARSDSRARGVNGASPEQEGRPVGLSLLGRGITAQRQR